MMRGQIGPICIHPEIAPTKSSPRLIQFARTLGRVRYYFQYRRVSRGAFSGRPHLRGMPRTDRGFGLNATWRHTGYRYLRLGLYCIPFHSVGREAQGALACRNPCQSGKIMTDVTGHTGAWSTELNFVIRPSLDLSCRTNLD